VHSQSTLQRQLRRQIKKKTFTVSQQFIVIDDNALPHRSILVNQRSNEQSIKGMNESSYLPDCSPIEDA
jgi:hypothetical protein